MNSIPIKPLEGIADIWRGDELAASEGQVTPTGSRELNAQLPGGGWPVGALVEVLQAHSGQNDWRLLLPALCHVQGKTTGVLVLVGAPHTPFAPGLAGQGLNPQRLLCVNTAPPASRLWAAEQALRCKDVAAVLAWLPQARADSLRRLQIAAAEHQKLLFVMRPAKAQNESSPAVLRVLASNAADGDALLLHILKRRGPPLEQALTLAARPARLAVLLAVGGLLTQTEAGGRRLGDSARQGGMGVGGQFGVRSRLPESDAPVSGSVDRALTPIWPPTPIQTGAELLDFPLERSDALDRAAA